MKYILHIVMVVLVGMMCCCSKTHTSESDELKCTLVYDVFWTPNYVERCAVSSNEDILVYSSHGTNYVKLKEPRIDGEDHIFSTTAPIRKVSYSTEIKRRSS